MVKAVKVLAAIRKVLRTQWKRFVVRGGRTFLWFFLVFILMNFAKIGQTIAGLVPAVWYPAVFALVLSAVMALELMVRNVKAERKEEIANAMAAQLEAAYNAGREAKPDANSV